MVSIFAGFARSCSVSGVTSFGAPSLKGCRVSARGPTSAIPRGVAGVAAVIVEEARRGRVMRTRWSLGARHGPLGIVKRSGILEMIPVHQQGEGRQVLPDVFASLIPSSRTCTNYEATSRRRSAVRVQNRAYGHLPLDVGDFPQSSYAALGRLIVLSVGRGTAYLVVGEAEISRSEAGGESSSTGFINSVRGYLSDIVHSLSAWHLELEALLTEEPRWNQHC